MLIIDNDPGMLESLQTLFSGWGFSVFTATNADSASEIWEEAGPDLLILDYHLDQGHTGLELIERLQAGNRHCPTIMISADHAAEVRQAARSAGCEFLHKPIRPLALKSLVSRLSRR